MEKEDVRKELTRKGYGRAKSGGVAHPKVN